MLFFENQNNKKKYNGQKKQINFKSASAMLCLALVFSAAGVMGGCGTELGKQETNAEHIQNEDEKFEAYTEELFRKEVSANTVSLHYTLKTPEEYGIESAEVTFGTFEQKPEAVKAAAENMRKTLLEFQYDELDIKNRITYDILNYRLKMMKKSADYLMYEEPLGIVSGVQTQLPVVLSEYRFYDREDVETYLALVRQTREYFQEIIEFEKKKAEYGLFMSDQAVEAVIGQCRAFLEMGNGNYLYSTFADRISELDKLTEKEKSDYIQENALAVNDDVFPAYEQMISELENLKGSGKNEKGLVYFTEGKAYYELLVRQSTGSERSVEELKDLARRQINDDLTAMEQVLGLTTKEAKEAAALPQGKKAEQILEQLKEDVKIAFPEPPDTELEVKYVPKAMEEHLSPAFYMIPAIDNSQQNVIYINQARMGNDMTLFTTLAHEGYPGHLYQTIYYESTDPDPIRSLLDFGGYVEGWATYAEMGSYYLIGISKDQAILLQKNASIILALYALADMGIHYDGWSMEDMAAFFKNYGITDESAIGEIYKLILGSPANYLKYYIGYVEFLELKKKWSEEKGKDFLQKEFHSAVLNIGPAPFEIIEDYMWKF